MSPSGHSLSDSTVKRGTYLPFGKLFICGLFSVCTGIVVTGGCAPQEKHKPGAAVPVPGTVVNSVDTATNSNHGDPAPGVTKGPEPGKVGLLLADVIHVTLRVWSDDEPELISDEELPEKDTRGLPERLIHHRHPLSRHHRRPLFGDLKETTGKFIERPFHGISVRGVTVGSDQDSLEDWDPAQDQEVRVPIDLYSLEIERQGAGRDAVTSAWSEVSLNDIVKVVTLSMATTVDRKDPIAAHFIRPEVTMPLPRRSDAEWGTEATHPYFSDGSNAGANAVLVRFLDFTAGSGRKYRYRVRLLYGVRAGDGSESAEPEEKGRNSRSKPPISADRPNSVLTDEIGSRGQRLRRSVPDTAPRLIKVTGEWSEPSNWVWLSE